MNIALSSLPPDYLGPTETETQIVLGLATLYYRHNDPARALALGLMVMRCGDDSPRVVLLVASCFLKAGDADQAAAALSRLEDRELSDQDNAAFKFLKAKTMFRLGEQDEAEELLYEARQFLPQEDIQ